MATISVKPPRERQPVPEKKWTGERELFQRALEDPPRRWRGVLWRVLWILALALAMLLLWQGVAYAQTPETTRTRGQFLFDTPAESDRARAGDVGSDSRELDPVGADNPTVLKGVPTIAEWIRQLEARFEREDNPRATAAADLAGPPSPPSADGAGIPEGAPPHPIAARANLPTDPSVRRDSVLPNDDSSSARTVPTVDLEFRDTSGLPAGELPDPPVLGDLVTPLGEISDEDVLWAASLELALSFDLEFPHFPPAADPRVLRGAFFQRLIDLSVTLGVTDNPRDNLDAVRSYLFETLGVQAVVRDRAELKLLLPRVVLTEGRGSPAGVGILVLVLADRLSPYLHLEAVLAGGRLGFRYRSGHHRYTLVPTEPKALFSDRDLLRTADPDAAPSDDGIRVLTRREFWGLVCAEAGAALLDEGHVEWASRLIARGLKLFRENPRAHTARARLHLEEAEWEAAREALNTALELDPRDVRARLERIDVLEALGDTDALEADLRKLTRMGKHPEAILRLARLLLERLQYRAALAEVERLESLELSTGLGRKTAHLRRQVEAAPWIAQLGPTVPDRDRFEAVDRLAGYPLEEAKMALVELLDDPNLRLAQYAWKTLGTLTHFDLPPIAAEWRRALEELRKRQP